MAADKYNIAKLKAMAEKSLCKSLKLENVIWIAAHAYIYNGHSVLASATEMIVDKFEQVTEQPTDSRYLWNSLNGENLFDIILIYLLTFTKNCQRRSRFIFVVHFDQETEGYFLGTF